MKISHFMLRLTTALILSLATFTYIATISEASAKMPQVKLGDQLVNLEVASSTQEIQNGLMWRTALPETQGMVFLFPDKRAVRFWMFNCFINLDMIFIKDGKIVEIAKNVPPCKSKTPEDCPLYPESGQISVEKVIEVAGGFCDRHKVQIGDPVQIDLEK